ncbi:MAG: hypothetical protein C7B46_07930 [Sulfobacillus benefaciens]|uniref:Rhodanese domain-containing protein n=1 Tax=Sulfobacillus benefaciens TaxID=453960 RepID=A0A2T2XHE4_9FIRM|nr:MAG: hypothetical protein C7B46_07930 [Sulfobacillus benefaciens]
MKSYDAAELMALDERSVTWIDVRPAISFIQGYIKGSRNAPFNKKTSVPKDVNPIVVLGPAGVLARKAALTWESSGHNVLGYLEASFTAIAGALPQQKIHQVQILPPSALHSWSGILLDVRLKEDVNSGFIAGSMWIPLPDLEHSLSNVPRNKPLLVYCNSGSKAVEAAAQLASAGFDQVSVIAQGGMESFPGGLT